DLGKAEAHAEHRIGYACILVETGGDAERIGKVEPPHADGEARVIGTGGTRIDAGLQRLECQLVRHLRLEREQQWPSKVECRCKHLSVLCNRLRYAMRLITAGAKARACALVNVRHHKQGVYANI